MQLRNELDVVLAQQRARECAQLAGITGAAQTKFATAVSETCRHVIERVGLGDISIGLRLGEPAVPALEAVVTDRGRETFGAPTTSPDALIHARQLVDEIDVSREATGARVTLRQRLPARQAVPSDALVQQWRTHLARPAEVSPYEELKRQNDQLISLYEELQEKNQLAERQINVISRLNYELEKLNAANESLLTERAAQNFALERRNEELDAFAHTISHDLKSPLHNINGLAQVIEQGVAANDLADVTYCTGLLQQQADWMDRMIYGILAYARAGREALERTPVNVAELAANVARAVQLPVGFRVHVSPDLPTLLTEEISLQQVLSNLIGNAGKYHDRPATGNAWVAARAHDGQLEFSVTDDGPGIRPADRATLFQIFQVTSHRATHDSTGVGLAIVRKIVRDKGGDVRVETGPDGRGTRFVFGWPAQEIVPPAE